MPTDREQELRRLLERVEEIRVDHARDREIDVRECDYDCDAHDCQRRDLLALIDAQREVIRRILRHGLHSEPFKTYRALLTEARALTGEGE